MIKGGRDVEGANWKYLPADIVERSVLFEFSYIGVDGTGNTLDYTPSSVTKGKTVDTEKDDECAQEVEDIANSFGFNDQMLRWKDSNHECILFSNSTHTVRFLSFDPSTLRRNMHPQLLHHLEDNGITVGENLNDLIGKDLWTLLSSITGVDRNAKEASEVMDESFCLTPDSLMKMLAIFYRIRCGIPVVLLGKSCLCS